MALLNIFQRIFRAQNATTRARIGRVYLLLVAANVGAWIWALITFRDHPIALGTALLAYGFGLRHAVDADHIAAIDNVTRKLMQEGKRPVAVGFFFALGHSTVVLLASLAIAITANAIQTKFEAFQAVGGIVGTSVSAFFLLLIAVMNIFIMVGTWRTFRQMRRSGTYHEHDLDLVFGRGIASRLLRPAFKLITKSEHMYPLGFLFGLGFDTATEIALLGISATAASKGMPLWSVLVFPVLFTVGMTLVDTTDGILMLGAYGWAYLNPMRKIFYNLTITGVSVIVALAIGAIEALGLVAGQLSLKGPCWDFIGLLNDNFGLLGYIIIGLFILSWTISMLIYRLKRYDDVIVVRAEKA